MKNVLKALHLLVASNEIKEVGESLENKTENVNAVRTTIQQYIILGCPRAGILDAGACFASQNTLAYN